jgi:hypothetical protein
VLAGWIFADVRQCSSQETAEATEYSNRFDANGDGLITESEFVYGAPSRNSTNAAAQDAFNKVDANGDGSLDQAELNNAISEWAPGCLKARTCEDCLRYMDATHPAGSCRWYASERTCRTLSYKKKDKESGNCEIPINSVGQCWSSTFAFQIGDFLAVRPYDANLWAVESAAHFRDPMQEFRTYPAGTTGLFDLATGRALGNASDGGEARSVVVSAVCDWGTGTAEADVIGKFMAAEKPVMTIHCGDVYWVGTPGQYQTNVLGVPANSNQQGVFFPKGSHTTFLTGGNHEQISGYTGMYVDGFGYSGQTTSYGAYQSDSWRIIILDSGYLSYAFLPGANKHRNMLKETDAPQPDQVIDWLQNVVKLDDPNDKRGIVLVTHHMPYSDWDKEYLGTAKQLNSMLKGRSVVWFFGHEHRLAFYTKLRLQEAASKKNPAWESDFDLFPRMVGNGGFPDTMPPPSQHDGARLLMWDNRTYQTIPQDPFPAASISFNGFFKIEVDGDAMDVSYITAKCKQPDNCDLGYDNTSSEVVAQETYTVNKQTGEIAHKWNLISDGLTKSPRFEEFKNKAEALIGTCSAPDPGKGLLWNLQNI